jgi:hypothetical protein
MDPRIGQLNTGSFYAFVNGYSEDPFTGTLEEVEGALGLRKIDSKPKFSQQPSGEKTFNVRLTFQYPAWDEIEGILYAGIPADSKSEANKVARKLARIDGHLTGGRGRVYFKAEQTET